MTSRQAHDLVFVTGPAGSGRGTALRVLEDLGFETVDNLPLHLVEAAISDGLTRPLALGIDGRGRDFDAQRLLEIHDHLRGSDTIKPCILFIDCAHDILMRRYSETRRRHPLSDMEGLSDGLSLDRNMVAPLRNVADVLIDSSELTVHDLRAAIERHFAPESGRFLELQICSFSYKRGLPVGIDMIFDVRFLRNPHWDPQLRPLTGRDREVVDYISQDDNFASFTKHCFDMVDFLLPNYKREGKSHFGIGFGCTGGQHRSVALAEALAQNLRQSGWQNLKIWHRELERNAAHATGN